MRKLILLFAVLTPSVELWAQEEPVIQTVSYLYPEYNDGDVTKGIKEWKTTTANATVVGSSPVNVDWGMVGTTTWYVVEDADTQIAEYVICNGDVRLILADDAMLTVNGYDNYPGIQVSGDGNSLTIYGQANSNGVLNVTGGKEAAGIGGGHQASGFNIVINGGAVSATGGTESCGIGGGYNGNGSNIIINDGIVTATGGEDAALEGTDNENIKAIATLAYPDIKTSTTTNEIDFFKTRAIANINSAKAAYADGKAEALGTMGEPCTDCPSVEVKKGTKTIKLYNPEKVEFKKE